METAIGRREHRAYKQIIDSGYKAASGCCYTTDITNSSNYTDHGEGAPVKFEDSSVCARGTTCSCISDTETKEGPMISAEDVVEPSERPTFSTNIFDGREPDPEPEPELLEPQVAHWFWFCTVIAIFCFGVASSYYIINA